MRPVPANMLAPRVKTAWRIAAAITICLTVIPTYLLILIIMIATGTAQTQGPLELAILSGITLAVLAVSLLIFCVVVPQLRYIRWRYEVGQWELDIQKGIIWRTRIIVPFIRVQNTDTKQGPIQRALGLASVTVSTAAGSHEIPGLTADEADKLRDAIATQARLAQEDI